MEMVCAEYSIFFQVVVQHKLLQEKPWEYEESGWYRFWWLHGKPEDGTKTVQPSVTTYLVSAPVVWHP